jgi:hypothetical protein
MIYRYPTRMAWLFCFGENRYARQAGLWGRGTVAPQWPWWPYPFFLWINCLRFFSRL